MGLPKKGFQEDISWAIADIQGTSAFSLERDRPYDGQPHTDRGKRGQEIVKGLTMRDVSDCIVRGFLDAAGHQSDFPIHDDMYKLDLNEVDPGTVIQNAMCHVERMMGIYPNVPPLTYEPTKEARP